MSALGRAVAEAPPFVLRAARPSDGGEIRALVRSERLNPLDLHHAAFVVAAVGPTVIGAVQIRHHADGSRELGSLVVAPAWRGRGVATALVEARLAGVSERVHLVTRRASAGLYARWGFRPAPRASLPAAIRRNLWMGQLASIWALLRGLRPRGLVALARPAACDPRHLGAHSTIPPTLDHPRRSP